MLPKRRHIISKQTKTGQHDREWGCIFDSGGQEGTTELRSGQLRQRNSKCKGPGVDLSLERLKDRKVSMPGHMQIPVHPP